VLVGATGESSPAAARPPTLAVASQAAGCSTVASPGPGAVQRLVDRLRPGQTGCVRGGTYRESVTISRGGTGARARVTLQSYPGERATLIGRLYLRNSANYVTVAGMNLNGRNQASLPSPDIAAAFDQFVGNDVTDEHTEICFILGSPVYGFARNALIQGNRIHDCGVLPSRNGDHGIYVAFAYGTKIVDNVIFDNTDRGIQLYPDAQGSLIEHNILDANGENIAFGGEQTSSSNNLVEYNLITNAVLGSDVQSYYPGPVGVGNIVKGNCLFGGAHGTIYYERGFTAKGLGNIVADPGYANVAAGDFSVAPNSRCAADVVSGTPVTPF
jgi:parallel beta-helix repeat protein